MSKIEKLASDQGSVADVRSNNRMLNDDELGAVAGGNHVMVFKVQLRGWPSPIYYPVPCPC